MSMGPAVELVTALLLPDRCGGCDRYGSLICARCSSEVGRLGSLPVCPRCAAPYGDLVCTECEGRELSFSSALSLGYLDGVLARMVVLYKDQNDRRLGPLLGMLLGQRVALHMPGWAECVTWVPPSQRALGKRGFDHAGLIAEAVAWAAGAEPRALLAHRGGQDLRGRGRARRAEVVRKAFVAREDSYVSGRVLLVDDVMTTGATVSGCAQLLLDLGAEEVRVAVLARAL